MPISTDHEIIRKRFRRNLALGGVLVAFVLLVFLITIAKIRQGSLMEGFDHTYRASLAPLDESESKPENGTGSGEVEAPEEKTR